MSPQPDASSSEIRKNLGVAECHTEQWEVPSNTVTDHQTSGWHWGEALFSCRLFRTPSLALNFTCQSISPSFQLTILLNLSSFLSIGHFFWFLQTCTNKKSALNILGKYPCISNMFGEDEIHLCLWFKAVFVRKEIGKCWPKGKAKTEIHTAQWFSLKNK